MKILLEQTEYKEIDIELPFYAYYQGEDKEEFVMIDEKYFRKITIPMYGFGVELTRFNANGYISRVWYNNKTTKAHYDEALRNAKKYIKQF